MSLILLISAQLGSEGLYGEALERMTSAMQEVELNPYKAWLYGRILFAAQSIGDKKSAFPMRANLKALLKTLLKNDETRFNRFTAWALGYFTALNHTDYEKYKELMVDIARHLIQTCFEIVTSTSLAVQKQEVRSDCLWTWVMIIQVAANHDDALLYECALNQLMNITQQPSISVALTRGLLRTESSNDYPAWAMAIVQLAAQTKGDQIHFKELEVPLAQSLEEAKSTGKTEEWLLALVNAQLAVAREKL